MKARMGGSDRMAPAVISSSSLLLRLPLIQKLCHRIGSHLAHRLELALDLAVEQFSVSVENSQLGHAVLERYAILCGDVRIAVIAADIDMHQHEIILQQLEIGGLMEINVEHLAIDTPVASEIEDDPLVLVLRRN